MALNSNKIVLWEYDRPLVRDRMLNHLPGIWKWCMSPGSVTVADDQGKTGYYTYTNAEIYNIKSAVVDGTVYLNCDSLSDLRTSDEAFYYDRATKTFYIAFTGWGKPLDRTIFIGAVIGFANRSDGLGNYYEYNYYEPIVKSIGNLKKSKDPIFFGMLKFNSSTVKLINNEGTFDDWKDRRAYKQPSRVLVGNIGDDYDSFIRVCSGVLGEHSRSWSDFSIKIEDARTVLSNKIPVNTLSRNDYPYLSSSNVDAKIPIAYGKIRGAKCICLNENEGNPEEGDDDYDENEPGTGSEPAYYQFIICDTTNHAIASIDTIYVDGVKTDAYSTNLTAGTFYITNANCYENLGDVTADFTMNTSDNGVEIIKLLMSEYSDTEYISEYYNTTEMVTASNEADNRSDSFYAKSETDVKRAIEKISNDIDGLFFQQDSGLWTCRIFDLDREPVATIQFDEFLSEPEISGNEDQFLTSVIIQYGKNQDADDYLTYENTDYEDEAFREYKAYQSKTIETGLSDEASAMLKSETIMYFSKNIKDTVKIKVPFYYYYLEIMDFIVCDPRRRRSGTDSLSVWEILEISKSLDSPFTIETTLREIEDYYFHYSESLYNDSITFINNQKLSGTIHSGLFNNMTQSYYKSSTHSDFSTLSQYGRVWVYDSALAVYAKLANGDYSSAADEINALVNLMKYEDSLGFNGVLHFSYNTIGDGFVDPKGPLGAVAWVLKVIWFYIYLTGNTTHQAYLITKTEWMLTQQVTSSGDDRYGLFRAGLANTTNTDGYTTYTGDFNEQQGHCSIEHNADCIDMLYLAYKVTGDADYKTAADLARTSIYNLWQTDHFCTGMESDGTINTNVAIDNNTWVASSILPYDEETAWKCILYVYNNFVITSTSAGGGYSGYYGCKFFDGSFSDSYVSANALYDTMIQPEATWGFIHLLICFYDTTTDEDRKKFCLDLGNDLIYSMLRFKKTVTESGYGTAYSSLDILNLFSTMESTAATATAAYVLAEIKNEPLRKTFIGMNL